MDEREAKDFLVQQAAEQASLEDVPLSDLEKRMMYFTESGYVPEDPIKLNEEFEAQYDTQEYEEKISKLLKNAHKRISAESEAKRQTWDDAIKVLGAGDHYIMVMCDGMGFSQVLAVTGRVPLSTWLRLVSRLTVVAVVVFGAGWLVQYFATAIGIRSSYLYFALFIAVYLIGVLPGGLLKRGFMSLVVFLVGRREERP